MLKESVDDYKGGPLIPSFEIKVKLVNHSKPRPLEQRIVFDGIEPTGQFIAVTREPRKCESEKTDKRHSIDVSRQMSIAQEDHECDDIGKYW